VFDLLSHQQVEAQAMNESYKSQDVLTSNKTDFNLDAFGTDTESVTSERAAAAEKTSVRSSELLIFNFIFLIFYKFYFFFIG
jgi:hypothetical protein